MLMTKNGIVFENGKKVFSWEQYVNVLKGTLDQQTLNKVVKRLNQVSEYDDMKLDQELDLERLNCYAVKLGLKPGKTIKAVKSSIQRKIKNLKLSTDKTVESL